MSHLRLEERGIICAARRQARADTGRVETLLATSVLVLFRDAPLADVIVNQASSLVGVAFPLAWPGSSTPRSRSRRVYLGLTNLAGSGSNQSKFG